MSEQLIYNIRLEKLTLSGFRCFNNLEVFFDQKLTVFISENGGGKTAVLDVIAEGLKAYVAALKMTGHKQCSLKGKDVKKGERKSENSLTVTVEYPVKLINLIDANQQEEMDSRQDNAVDIHIDIPKYGNSSYSIGSQSVVASYNELAKNRLNQDNQIVMPVLVYYGGDSVKINYDVKDKAKNRSEYIYKNALTSSRINYTALYEWFDTKFKIFREQKDANATIKMEESAPELFKIKKAVEWIMNDNDDEVYKDLRITTVEDELSKLVISKKNTADTYDDMEINQLSSGEKALFAFVADLGLRLLHATPLATNVNTDHAYKILGKGIVLIDEVDLHLHLLWQQKVIDKLMEIFPEVQFVMSTHSLLVLGKLRSNNVRLFLDNELYSIPEMYGQDIGTIIEKIWKIPSNIFKPRIREVYRLIATNVLDNILAAKAEVENIEKEIGNSTPALIEAQTIIKHKEKALMS